MKESAERAKHSIVVIAAVLMLVATACGSAEPAAVADDTEVATVFEDPEESAEATTPATSEAVKTSVVPDTVTPTTATPTTTETPAEEVDRKYPAFPVLDDPCSVVPEVGDTTYSIFVEGQERPVLVSYNEASAVQGSQRMMIAFHGAGRGPSVAPTDLSIGRSLFGGIFVVPFADDSNTPFWSASPTFNVAYLEALYPALRGALCFDDTDTVVSGTGQGAFMVAEAICSTDIPMAQATMTLSFISFEECAPSRNVPIVSFDVFEFRANLGGHWDGTWDPPGDYQLNRTGGIGPVPEDLDEWASVYGCEGPRQEETIPDEGDLLERDSLLYSYPDCEASLHAFGFENGDTNPIPIDALLAARPRLLEILAAN